MIGGVCKPFCWKLHISYCKFLWGALSHYHFPNGGGVSAAESIALTEACSEGRGKEVNIYTDLKYAFGMYRTKDSCRNKKSFMTSSSGQRADAEQIKNSLQAISLPEKISVMHQVGSAHQRKDCPH